MPSLSWHQGRDIRSLSPCPCCPLLGTLTHTAYAADLASVSTASSTWNPHQVSWEHPFCRTPVPFWFSPRAASGDRGNFKMFSMCPRHLCQSGLLFHSTVMLLQDFPVRCGLSHSDDQNQTQLPWILEFPQMLLGFPLSPISRGTRAWSTSSRSFTISTTDSPPA